MHVLMVGVDESTKGGMWTVVENYLNNPEFIKKNNLVYIPTSVTGCSVLKRLLFTLIAYIKIINAFRKTKFSIVHVHMSERASIYRKRIVMEYAKRKGAKIVLHMHGAEFEVLYKKMNPNQKATIRKTLNLADKIVILGEYWREFIGSLVDDSSKIRVVYNAVDVPEEYKYNEDSRNILFLGAISKRKGIDILLSALKENEKSFGEKCIVNIYGPDTDENINEKLEKNGLSSWVKYHGWLDKKKKQIILANTAINVLPSYNEGLPMTILEAMSYGIPSITTSVAAIPEAVNEKNGIVIKPGDKKGLSDALQELIFNREKRLQLSRQAYEDAKNIFSIEQHIMQIQEIYEEVMKR